MWQDLVQPMAKPRTTAWRRTLIAVVLTLAVMGAPIRARTAQPQPPQASDGGSGAGLALGTHATRGIVLAIDANTMVIARAGKRGLMTFSLTSSTLREGVIVVDSAVSVRYREDGKNHVATAIALQRTRE
jgi:type IV secretory pathway TrbL component